MSHDKHIFRALLEFAVPGYACPADMPTAKVGTVDEVGDPRVKDDPCKTKNGNYSRAVLSTSFGAVRVWWSYRTPIALQHLPSGLALRSTYSYSNSTNKHQSATRLHGASASMVMTYYGHVGDGMIKPSDIIEQRVGWVHQHKLALSRARERKDWAASQLKGRLQHLEEACIQLDVKAVLPEFGEGLSDKAHAKLLGLGLNHSDIASAIQTYNTTRTDLLIN